MESLITHKEAAQMPQAASEEQPHMRTSTKSDFDLLPPRQQKELSDWYVDLAYRLIAELEAEKAGKEEAAEGERVVIADKQIQCASCGRSFTFTAGEQNHYQDRGISEPKRCKECRDARQSDSGGRKGRGAQMKEAARQMDALFKPAKKGSKKAEHGSDQ